MCARYLAKIPIATASAQYECGICDSSLNNGPLRRELFEKRSGESAELLQSASGSRYNHSPKMSLQHFNCGKSTTVLVL